MVSKAAPYRENDTSTITLNLNNLHNTQTGNIECAEAAAIMIVKRCANADYSRRPPRRLIKNPLESRRPSMDVSGGNINGEGGRTRLFVKASP